MNSTEQSMGINDDKAAESPSASSPKAAPTAGSVTAPGVLYTPGPLRVRRSIRNNDHAVMTANGDIVAECYAAIRRHDENAAIEASANAHLYAAAPQMVEALQLYEKVRNTFGNGMTFADVDRKVELALAAAKVQP